MFRSGHRRCLNSAEFIDLLDGREQHAWIKHHLATCPKCQVSLAETKAGAYWSKQINLEPSQSLNAFHKARRRSRWFHRRSPRTVATIVLLTMIALGVGFGSYGYWSAPMNDPTVQLYAQYHAEAETLTSQTWFQSEPEVTNLWR